MEREPHTSLCLKNKAKQNKKQKTTAKPKTEPKQNKTKQKQDKTKYKTKQGNKNKSKNKNKKQKQKQTNNKVLLEEMRYLQTVVRLAIANGVCNNCLSYNAQVSFIPYWDIVEIDLDISDSR